MMQEVERLFGHSFEMIGAAAGMHLTMLLPRGYNDREIASAARQRKLWLSALSESYIGATRKQGLVLGYGNTAVSQIPGALAVLKEIGSR